MPQAPDSPPRADALVLFGISGDLARKSLLPALYRLVLQGELTARVVGVTRGGWTLDRLLQHAHDSVADRGPVDEDAFARFVDLLRLATVDYDDPDSFRSVAEATRDCRFLTHYLAIPPTRYATAAQRLAQAGLNGNARLVVEKPFGHDLRTARALQTELLGYFPEERLRRVDHFLGKDVIENLLTVRSANTLLDGILHRPYVRGVQITLAEDFAVADRGGFYDATGCLRDVVQNHLLQTLAHLVMEAPRSGGAEDLLDEKVRALRAVRTVRREDCVRGQFDGYRDTQGVKPDSRTETYSALRTYVDTDRWNGVPFTLRAGKCLAETATEIVVELDRPAPGYFHTRCAQSTCHNLVRLRISPRAGLAFDLLAQRGGDPTAVERVAARLDFTGLGGDDVTAYAHILRDAVSGDPRRFSRMDVVEECWRIVEDVLDPGDRPLPYRRGSWGPERAAELAMDGRWLPLDRPDPA